MLPITDEQMSTIRTLEAQIGPRPDGQKTEMPKLREEGDPFDGWRSSFLR